MMGMKSGIARKCAIIGVGNSIDAGKIRKNLVRTQPMTAVERVLAIRAAKVEKFRQIFAEDKTGTPAASCPVTEISGVKNYLPRNIFKPLRRRPKKEREPEKEIILNGQSNFSCAEPMRPWISLKVLNVYARSRGGRSEPGRRFARNKEVRKGDRVSLRRMPVIDSGYDDSIDFELLNYAVAALFDAV